MTIYYISNKLRINFQPFHLINTEYLNRLFILYIKIVFKWIKIRYNQIISLFRILLLYNALNVLR